MIRKHLTDYPGVRTVQKEAELNWLMDTLLQNQVQSLLSIGLLDGGTEWHIARRYREEGRDIAMTGVDIHSSDTLQQHIQEIVHQWGQSFTFLQQSSHEMNLPGRFDAVWIDGDHSYEGVKQDFEWASNKANTLIALHDIVDSSYHRKQGCFVSRLWAEIQSSGFRTESRVGRDWAGIGIVYLAETL